jgi:hypothetical protein
MSISASPRNPYFNLPLSFDPDSYYGSQAWADFALRGISNTPPRSIELIGLPGMGKTSLLRYLADPEGALIKNKGALQSPFSDDPSMIFPFLVEFRLLPTGMHPFVYLYKRFHEEYPNYRERFKKSAKSGGLPDLKDNAFPKSSSEATAALEEDLTELKEFGVRPVFLLDDFHLAFGEVEEEEATRLRPWRDRVAYVIVTEQRLEKVNPKAAGSPFFQTLPKVRVGGLTPAEAKRLASEPAKLADAPFHLADVNFVLAQADGHPHLLILGGGTLWDARNSLMLPANKKASISKEFPELLLAQLEERFRPAFRMYWEHLDKAEQAALRAAADTKEVASFHYPALAFLAQLGVVKFNPETRNYEPFSRLFKEFIQSQQAIVAPQISNGLELSGLEATLYEYLKQHPDHICTFDELSQVLWEEKLPEAKDAELLRRRVQVTVSRLRKKLQESGAGNIISSRDQGYRLILT